VVGGQGEKRKLDDERGEDAILLRVAQERPHARRSWRG
jgi:hypothetical protein